MSNVLKSSRGLPGAERHYIHDRNGITEDFSFSFLSNQDLKVLQKTDLRGQGTEVVGTERKVRSGEDIQ